MSVSYTHLDVYKRQVLGFAEDERLRARNRAVDQLKSRFGESIIKRGILK